MRSPNRVLQKHNLWNVLKAEEDIVVVVNVTG
jgi:hypothetical protein